MSSIFSKVASRRYEIISIHAKRYKITDGAMIEAADAADEEGFVLVLSLLDHFGGVWIELLDSHAGKKKEKRKEFSPRTGISVCRKETCA